MKALVKYGKGIENIGIKDVPVPVPKQGEVRIKVNKAGICGTDIHIYNDRYAINPPVILGHELSGVVDALGENVSGFCAGQRVISETYYYTCGVCNYCKTGKRNLCLSRLSIGSLVNGAFAEYVVVPAHNLHVIPDNVSFEQAALTEPLACCCQTVLEKAQLIAGENVLLTGPGPIGSLCLQLVKLAGCKCIIVGTSRGEERRETAKTLGADLVLCASDEGLLETVIEAYDGIGPDTVIECSGSEDAIRLGMNAIKKGGRFVQMAFAKGDIQMNINQVAQKEITLIGSFAQKWQWWEKSLRLLADGSIKAKPVISGIFPLDKWQEAFNSCISGKGLKYLIEI